MQPTSPPTALLSRAWQSAWTPLRAWWNDLQERLVRTWRGGGDASGESLSPTESARWWVRLGKRGQAWMIVGGCAAVLGSIGWLSWQSPRVRLGVKVRLGSAYARYLEPYLHDEGAELVARDQAGREVAAVRTEAALAANEERVASLENQVQELQGTLISYQAELRAAVEEVAASNDVLVQERDALKRALASAGSPTSGSSSGETTTNSGASSSTDTTGSVATHKINLNSASAAELDTLPGIGPAYAERIIDYREKSGGFRTVDDLLEVTGIGPATLAKIKDLVEV